MSSSEDVTVKGHPTSMDLDVGEVLAGELIAVCIAALKQYGVSSRRLGGLCRQGIAHPGKMPIASRLMRDTDRLAELATEWMENTEYVDAAGRPKVLAIRGPAPSFACLAKKFFRRRSLSQILELGTKTQVLERVGKDKVAQFGGCVIFAGNPNLMLVHAVQSVRSFLATTLVNAVSNGTWLTRLPDRKAFAIIPQDSVAAFIELMRQTVINTIEIGNRWLAAHESKGKSTRKVRAVKVGVHAYIFREPTSEGRLMSR